jgi:UDP-N-acetylmuramate--alanine ligase
VLAGLDMLIVTEVYAAGEKPVSGADGRALCRAIRARGKVDPIFLEDVNTLPQALADVLRGNDVLLTMGAGSIGSVAAALPQTLSKRGKA